MTPLLVDHSVVDACSFLIEVEGKRLLYSGDFRAHGRKSVLFDRNVKYPPENIDVLMMEGTMMKRSNYDFPRSVPAMDSDHVRMFADFRPDEVMKENKDFFGVFRKRAYTHRIQKEEIEGNPSKYFHLSKMSKLK
ncbi:MAG: hypothetical protein V2B20_27885 [Pseudomonadota bacterium]